MAVILRKLKKKDAPLMLEWMHDSSVVANMQTDFLNKTLDDCFRFIENSQGSNSNIHMAITDETDEYLGTISLKNILDGTAEFAITLRSVAMGKGFSSQAMREIINIGFNSLGLIMIYWCVNPENTRAIRFYDKNGYQKVDYRKVPVNCSYTVEQVSRYVWYTIWRREISENK